MKDRESWFHMTASLPGLHGPVASDVAGLNPATKSPTVVRALRRLRPNRYRKWLLGAVSVVTLAVLGGLTTFELRTSWAQAKATRDLWKTFTSTRSPTHQRPAWAYRSVIPDADSTSFARFLRAQGGTSLSADETGRLFGTTDARRLSWHDRGYLAGVHPIELWLMHYLQRHKDASWQDVSLAGKAVRQEVYRWLLDSKHTSAQDRRIRTLLEEAAFAEIHHGWKQLGYPFDTLVPSYATAIGSSADRPDGLAELVGIIVRNGVRYPARQIDEIHFGADTPFETVLSSDPTPPRRVLSPDVAAVLRNSLIDVVEHGTAVRAKAAVTLSNGSVLPIGGKTGTGNNRRNRFGPRGRRIGSQPINRTAKFIFFIGDRFFGVVTAYVSGPEADDFTFTSSLPTQILRTLGPALRPHFESDPVPPATQERPHRTRTVERSL